MCVCGLSEGVLQNNLGLWLGKDRSCMKRNHSGRDIPTHAGYNRNEKESKKQELPHKLNNHLTSGNPIRVTQFWDLVLFVLTPLLH